MSKVGANPIPISNEQIEIKDGTVVIKGQAGSLNISLPEGITVEKEADQLVVKRKSDQKRYKSLHGLMRTLIANGVKGVVTPWEKKLEVVGTGYNVKLQGEDLVFKIGYSHLVTFKKAPGIVFKTEGNNKVVVSGADKQLVGEVAYQIKLIKKPDVYKGKGIKYEGEKLRIKPGKKAKAAA